MIPPGSTKPAGLLHFGIRPPAFIEAPARRLLLGTPCKPPYNYTPYDHAVELNPEEGEEGRPGGRAVHSEPVPLWGVVSIVLSGVAAWGMDPVSE